MIRDMRLLYLSSHSRRLHFVSEYATSEDMGDHCGLSGRVLRTDLFSPTKHFQCQKLDSHMVLNHYSQTQQKLQAPETANPDLTTMRLDLSLCLKVR